MRVVLDTNVLLSAFLWEYGVSHKLFFVLLDLKAEIFTSQDIMLEFQRVLKRDFAFSDERAIDGMKWILTFAKIIAPCIKVQIVKEDPTDDKIIECALASNSSYIISYNKHLLKIKEYESIKIVRPEELLGILH